MHYKHIVFLLGEEEEEEEEKWRKTDGDETRIRHIVPLTTDPSPTIGFTDPSWDWLEKTTPLQTRRSEVRGNGVTEVFLPDSEREARHVRTLTYKHIGR